MTNFNESSYNSHINHINKKYSQETNPFKRIEVKNNIDYWRHERMYNLIKPFLNSGDKWLTVGDGVATDANWLMEQGIDVVASDISSKYLMEAKKKGYIKEWSEENAEKLSFDDNSFDYVLCKQSYHHFPRPYIAVYEMMRVARKGIILIEPNDVILHFPLLLAAKNLMDRINVDLINKYWKNRYSFEETGNYVYKVSEREIEKIAMGVNANSVAFKGLNDHFDDKLDTLSTPIDKKVFQIFKKKIDRKNFLSKLGLIPYQHLLCAIFNVEPEMSVISDITKNKYKFIKLKKNPYLD